LAGLVVHTLLGFLELWLVLGAGAMKDLTYSGTALNTIWLEVFL
jgi:hypothetical protein